MDRGVLGDETGNSFTIRTGKRESNEEGNVVFSRAPATVPVLWAAAVAAWHTYASSAGYPKTTMATRRQHLNHLGRSIGVKDPWAVTAGDLLEWFARQTWSAETRRSRRTTLQHFYRWGQEAGHIAASPAVGLPRVRPAPPRPRPAPEVIYRTALLAADEREHLMMRLAAEVGLRRAEVAQVHSRDLIPDLTGWSLLVHGKGGRERVVPLPDSLAAALRSRPAGFAFPGNDAGHLSPRYVGKLITRLMPEAWTMHTLRHRFATRAYGVDKDLLAVQELLGHASPATTRVYVAVSSDRLRATVNAANAEPRAQVS